jgi:dihydroneopterin triphosphate diphosphatase
MASVDFKTPISVLVLIHTSDLKVLLIERADKLGFWQSVTGSIETEDATLRETAIREVMEETGLDATQFDLSDWNYSQTYEIYEHWRYRYAPGVTQNVEHVFGLELPSIVHVKLAPNEHVAYEWVDWREAAKWVFSWTNVEALRLLGERHQLTL